MIHICQYVNFNGKLKQPSYHHVSCVRIGNIIYRYDNCFPLYYVEIDSVYIFNVRTYINFKYVGLWSSSSINTRVCLVNKHFRTG